MHEHTERDKHCNQLWQPALDTRRHRAIHIRFGIGAPVHVLQTGYEVTNIVQIAAVAVEDAMQREEKS